MFKPIPLSNTRGKSMENEVVVSWRLKGGKRKANSQEINVSAFARKNPDAQFYEFGVYEDRFACFRVLPSGSDSPSKCRVSMNKASTDAVQYTISKQEVVEVIFKQYGVRPPVLPGESKLIRLQMKEVSPGMFALYPNPT